MFEEKTSFIFRTIWNIFFNRIKLFVILLFVLFNFMSCISSYVEKLNLEDYGIFDYPNMNVYKSSADGMIDSTQYYITQTTINKTGWARMTTKKNIQLECLKKACDTSSSLGCEYIVIFNENEDIYDEISDVRYLYEIIFIPINRSEITESLKRYKIYKNTLYGTIDKKTNTLKTYKEKALTYSKISPNKFTVNFGSYTLEYTCLNIEWKENLIFDTDNTVVKNILKDYVVTFDNTALAPGVRKGTMDLGYNTCYTTFYDGSIIVNSFNPYLNSWIFAHR